MDSFLPHLPARTLQASEEKRMLCLRSKLFYKKAFLPNISFESTKRAQGRLLSTFNVVTTKEKIVHGKDQ